MMNGEKQKCFKFVNFYFAILLLVSYYCFLVINIKYVFGLFMLLL